MKQTKNNNMIFKFEEEIIISNDQKQLIKNACLVFECGVTFKDYGEMLIDHSYATIKYDRPSQLYRIGVDVGLKYWDLKK